MLFLPDEIKLFWRREPSWASLLFYCTRYATLLGHIPILYAAFATMPANVSPVSVLDGILSLIIL